MDKLVRITKDMQYERVIQDVLDGLRDGSVTDFIICARQTSDDEGTTLLHRYWFGDSSSINILGLLEYMKSEVINYIYGDGE